VTESTLSAVAGWDAAPMTTNLLHQHLMIERQRLVENAADSHPHDQRIARPSRRLSLRRI
jgi:hypothetical protein